MTATSNQFGPYAGPRNTSKPAVECDTNGAHWDGIPGTNQTSATPREQFARTKVTAVNGDVAAARLSLHELVAKYIDTIYWDGFTFISALQVALLTHQLDMASGLINRQYQTHDWLRVVFENSEPAHVHVLKLRVRDRSSALFVISDQLVVSERFDTITTRWTAIFHLLSRYYHQDPVESGEVYINLGDYGEVPGLAFCESRREYLLIPDPYYILSRGYSDLQTQLARSAVAWGQRRPIALWRGSTTGGVALPHTGPWRSLPRTQLCEVGRNHRDVIDAGFSGIVQMPDANAEEEIRRSGLMAGFVPPAEFNQYRYQIDIDGNTNSWPGLFQKLLTGSTVLKVASPQGYRQWYYDRLIPWLNFVPVCGDMSDLVDKIAWLRRNDDVARQIGERGQALALAMDCSSELQRACHTISSALRCFATQRRIAHKRLNAQALPDRSRETNPMAELSRTFSSIGICRDYTGMNFDGYAIDLQGWNSAHPIFERVLDACKPHIVIEVGTWKGASAVHMLEMAAKGNLDMHIICIDTWLGSNEMWTTDELRPLLNLQHGYPTLFPQFIFNMIELGFIEKVFPLPLTSTSAARLLRTLGVVADAIYIDAGHCEEEVYNDLADYYGLLRPGGILFGDDYHATWPGVVAAVNRFAFEKRLVISSESPKFMLTKCE